MKHVRNLGQKLHLHITESGTHILVVLSCCMGFLLACEKPTPMPKPNEPITTSEVRHAEARSEDRDMLLQPERPTRVVMAMEDNTSPPNPCADIPRCDLLVDGCVLDPKTQKCHPNPSWCETKQDPSKDEEWMGAWRERIGQLDVPASRPPSELLEDLFHDDLTCFYGDYRGAYFYVLEIDERGAILTSRIDGYITAFYMRRDKERWSIETLDRFYFPDTGLGAASWEMSKVQGRRIMNKSSYEYIVYEISRYTTHGTFTEDGRPVCCDGMKTDARFTLVLEDNIPVFHAPSRVAKKLSSEEDPPEFLVECEAVYGVRRDNKLHVTIREATTEAGQRKLELADTQTISLDKPYHTDRWCSVD